jgi:hypothetical protein
VAPTPQVGSGRGEDSLANVVQDQLRADTAKKLRRGTYAIYGLWSAGLSHVTYSGSMVQEEVSREFFNDTR